jgi:methylenetetrahydrofolate reductase (NADPH)
LALRGDPPGGLDAPWTPHAEGFSHAVELVRLLRELGDFCVGVAAFPEGHPECVDLETDARVLVEKEAAGAEYAVTQFFFDADDYFRLLDRASRLGSTIPIIPGVMPVTNVRQIQRMAQLSGAAFPADLAERLLAVEDNPEAVRQIGVDTATKLCARLLAGGAPGLHFYTLNRSTATREIYRALNLDQQVMPDR